MPSLQDLFPGIDSPNPDAAYQMAFAAAPAATMGRNMLNILGQTLSNAQQQAIALGQAQAQARAESSKNLVDAMQKSAEVQQKLFGNVAGLQESREANERIRDLWYWQPQSHEEALQWFLERYPYEVRLKAAGAPRPDPSNYQMLNMILKMLETPQTGGGYGTVFPDWGITPPRDPNAYLRAWLLGELPEKVAENMGLKLPPTKTDSLNSMFPEQGR